MEDQEHNQEQEQEQVPDSYLRDLSEEDVYSRLKQVPEFNKHISSLESGFNDSLSPIHEKISALERSLGTRASVDVTALKKLEEYDPKLYELLSEALPGAIKVNSLDESALRPFLEPFQNNISNKYNEDIVEAFYSASELNDIIPPVEGADFSPKTQRHKDFVEWYGRQGLTVQKSLSKLGPQYVKALKGFEKWEEGKNKERESTAGDKAGRLAGGAQPSANGRRPVNNSPKTEDEAFEAGFNEVMKSRKG